MTLAAAVKDFGEFCSPGCQELYGSVEEGFHQAFPNQSDVMFVRAPGRVNIIGEHTDYNGLPVLPMAIDRETVIAFAVSDDEECTIVNADGEHEPRKFDISSDIKSLPMGDWGTYVQAAAQAVCRWAEINSPGALPLNGFVGCVGGNIPGQAGLSSSSALVVASALAIARVNGIEISRAELSAVLAAGEHYVGTQGGGMDHAVILMAEQGAALKVDFFPVRVKPTKLPDGYVLVIANSMVSAKKTGEARAGYNTRVAECKLGLRMLRSLAKADYPAVMKAKLMSEFMDVVGDARPYIEQLPTCGMSLRDISAFTGLTEDYLTERCLKQRDGDHLPEPKEGFLLGLRCRHLLTESARVHQAVEAASRSDAAALMNQSHESCANDYGLSRRELETLVAALRRHGAVGARLTGAGFGGCTVALVHSDDVQRLIDGVWQDYYVDYLPTLGIPTPAVQDRALFACTAAGAACVMSS